jgi:hypothetical protein
VSSTAGSLVSAISVMLAAYGFLYNSVRDRFDAVKRITSKSGDKNQQKKDLAKAKGARRLCWGFSLVALLIFFIFLSQAVSEVEQAAEVNFSLHDYSTLEVALFVLIFVWPVITLFVGKEALALGDAVAKLK